MKLLLSVYALLMGLQVVLGQSASIIPEYTSPEKELVVFSVKKPIVLNCNVSTSAPLSSVSVEWKKNDDELSDIDSYKNRFKLSNSGSRYTLTVHSAELSDAGNWSCAALIDGEEKARSPITLVSTINVRIKPESINVVEEEKLRIECGILGNPPPSLAWRIVSGNYNGTVFDDRVEIKDYTDEHGVKVEEGLLVISKVNKTDRGEYFCIGTNRFYEVDRNEARAIIRIKDKYAALWPFLGICAEVIILCAVIIIYEKKRNKTELEESDTDQSPDQKNTPDHGKDANLRHRQ